MGCEMITPAYGLTATERVLPRLALDWTTGLAQPGVDVTRAGVATFVGSNGLIQSASVNTQRVDYSTGIAGMLVEEQRTNLLERSEEFENVYWSKNGTAAITSNTAIAPDGTLSADTLSGATSNATSDAANILQRVMPVSSNTSYTFTLYVKSAGSTQCRLVLRDASTGSAPNITATLNDSYQRISVALTTGASTTQINVRVGLTDGDVYIFGAQLEAGALPTSYIPTEATAVTRNADVATMTGTNFSDWFNVSEGTFEVIWSAPFSTNQTSFSAYLSNANRFENYRNNTGNIRMFAYSDGVLQTAAGAITNGGVGPFNCVLAYKSSNYGIAVNASNAVVATPAAIPIGVDKLAIGNSSSGLNYINGHIQKLSYWPQRITNNEIKAFSKG
jgi:hypothetical protein